MSSSTDTGKAVVEESDTLLLSTYLFRLNREDGSSACLVRIYPAIDGEGLVTLPQGKLVIGRDSSCELVLTDKDVSRQHATITYQGGTYTIADLGSTNGTFVNEMTVAQQALASGDLIHIGKNILKFLTGNDIEKQYHETVYSKMILDGLTNIPNRRFFQEVLEREIIRSQRHKRPLALILFDIDRFKSINDQYGHLAGDEVLRGLSHRIRGSIRRDEVFARYGGEEFTILLPECVVDQALQTAERIRCLMASEPIPVSKTAIPVTISIGIAFTAGEDTVSPEVLIQSADESLYEAKENGRNRVVYRHG